MIIFVSVYYFYYYFYEKYQLLIYPHSFLCSSEVNRLVHYLPLKRDQLVRDALAHIGK